MSEHETGVINREGMERVPKGEARRGDRDELESGWRC